MPKKIRRSSKGGYYHNMPHTEYWVQRSKEQLSESFSSADEVNQYIEDVYKDCLIDFCTRYEKLLKPFIKDGELVLAELNKAKATDEKFLGKYNRLLRMINSYRDILGKKQEKQILTLLKNVYKNTVINNFKELGRPIQGLELLNKKAVEVAVRQPFTRDGREFSDRIWDNLDKMQTNLRKTLAESIAKGESIQKTTRKFKEIMSNSTYNTARLIRTETMATYAKASRNSYRELGVDKLEILAEKVQCCDICRSYDGNIIATSSAEVGLDIPPFHPNCRCCVVPVVKWN